MKLNISKILKYGIPFLISLLLAWGVYKFYATRLYCPTSYDSASAGGFLSGCDSTTKIIKGLIWGTMAFIFSYVFIYMIVDYISIIILKIRNFFTNTKI